MSAPAPAAAAAPKAPAPAPAAAAPKASTAKTTKKTVKKATGAGTNAKPKKKTVRRKKPSASSRSATSAANAQNIWNAASVAQKELAQQSAQAAALRSDPLWYRADDTLQSIAEDSFMVSGGTEILPDQIELVEAALADAHMTRADVTPQAFACLLEQARRYALELLADAQDYAYSANRHEVTRPDLTLAQELRADQPMAVFTQQPKLALLAKNVNQKPLPPIPTTNYTGVVLPPKEHLLTARTFDVISGARVAQRMVSAPPGPPASAAKNATPKQPSYGASRGRQIPINISQSTRDAATAKPAIAPKPTTTAGSQSGAPSSTPIPTPTGTVPAPAVAPPATVAAPGAPGAQPTTTGMSGPQSAAAGAAKRKADQL